MPEPLEIRRLWYRLRLDADGVYVNRKPPIRWDDVAAIVVGPTLRAVATQVLLTRGRGLFARPCLHICVRGDPYPRAARAVVFGYRGIYGSRLRRGRPEDVEAIDGLLGEWRESVPEVAASDDVGVWWSGKPLAHWRRPAPPPPPTTHERVEKVEHELHDLQDQLRRIQQRKEHGHPPA